MQGQVVLLVECFKVPEYKIFMAMVLVLLKG